MKFYRGLQYWKWNHVPFRSGYRAPRYRPIRRYDDGSTTATISARTHASLFHVRERTVIFKGDVETPPDDFRPLRLCVFPSELLRRTYPHGMLLGSNQARWQTAENSISVLQTLREEACRALVAYWIGRNIAPAVDFKSQVLGVSCLNKENWNVSRYIRESGLHKERDWCVRWICGQPNRLEERQGRQSLLSKHKVTLGKH